MVFLVYPIIIRSVLSTNIIPASTRDIGAVLLHTVVVCFSLNIIFSISAESDIQYPNAALFPWYPPGTVAPAPPEMESLLHRDPFYKESHEL